MPGKSQHRGLGRVFEIRGAISLGNEDFRIKSIQNNEIYKGQIKGHRVINNTIFLILYPVLRSFGVLFSQFSHNTRFVLKKKIFETTIYNLPCLYVCLILQDSRLDGLTVRVTNVYFL